MPHVNSAEEARRVVDAAKFAPIGNRGLTTSRQGYGVDDYHKQSNDNSLVIVLILTSIFAFGSVITVLTKLCIYPS